MNMQPFIKVTGAVAPLDRNNITAYLTDRVRSGRVL